MFQALLSHINSIVNLTDEEEELFKHFFQEKKFRKKQYLAQQGEPCRYIYFVMEGALKAYITDEKGNNTIMQFAIEGWWVTENNSFFTGVPSIYNIDAIEDSHVLMLTLENYEKMLIEIPKMERYWRIMLEKRMIAMQRRLTILLTYSLEDNYKRLLEVYPYISSRFPQHLIASYLGTTAETLSRLRKTINSRKENLDADQ
jgi:CRP-like cAMP-binding protein